MAISIADGFVAAKQIGKNNSEELNWWVEHEEDIEDYVSDRVFWIPGYSKQQKRVIVNEAVDYIVCGLEATLKSLQHKRRGMVEEYDYRKGK